jgi:hypothetical protein
MKLTSPGEYFYHTKIWILFDTNQKSLFTINKNPNNKTFIFSTKGRLFWQETRLPPFSCGVLLATSYIFFLLMLPTILFILKTNITTIISHEGNNHVSHLISVPIIKLFFITKKWIYQLSNGPLLLSPPVDFSFKEHM